MIRPTRASLPANLAASLLCVGLIALLLAAPAAAAEATATTAAAGTATTGGTTVVVYKPESYAEYKAQLAASQIRSVTINKRLRSLRITLKDGTHVPRQVRAQGTTPGRSGAAGEEGELRDPLGDCRQTGREIQTRTPQNPLHRRRRPARRADRGGCRSAHQPPPQARRRLLEAKWLGCARGGGLRDSRAAAAASAGR